MPLRVFLTALGALLSLGACAGVTPDPRRADSTKLPTAELSPEQREELVRDESAAILAVSRQGYDNARRIAERVLAIDQRSARAHAVLGLTMLERAARQVPSDWRGQREAETHLELARQLAPGDAMVAWLHAIFLAETGHLSAAAAVAEEGLEAGPDAPLADRAVLLGAAGSYRYELGEERAALQHLQAYVALRPDDAEAAFRIGWCLLRRAEVPRGADPLRSAQLDAESAAKAFARCGELRPGDESAATAVALARIRAAELADERGEIATRDMLRSSAREQLRSSGERFADSAEVRFLLGLLAESDNDREAARAAYEAALERSPGHVGSALNYAALLVEAGESAAADAVLRRLLEVPAARTQLTRAERQRIDSWLADRDTSGGDEAQMPRML